MRIKTFFLFAVVAATCFGWRTGSDAVVYDDIQKTGLWEANYSVSMGASTNYNILIAVGTKPVFLDAQFVAGAGAPTNLYVVIRKGVCWTNAGGTNTTTPVFTNAAVTNQQTAGIYDLACLRTGFTGFPVATTTLKGEVGVPLATSWFLMSNSGFAVATYYIATSAGVPQSLPSPFLLEANSWYFLRVSNASLGSYNGTISVQIKEPSRR